ncbi:hypothetical protein Amsp01_015640 [Amycolatopsis sp. NBRC 101858]|uniref:hypothetical protein n=1 Tax=Amycolatopsis sp. NBRC 101858 TaxID=3032200 RepID=UPI00249FB475|nr:hypothetical protein [Amycolatopsis sp. NBRC 101858]GLY35540.1 hypothetical protein Amsp01_015640 [Amycolatopsis sp. NBRC 101858]
MSKENVAASEETEEKSGLRIAQVMAAALAAVTAALLGSTLGVAGTVVGAGVASVITTVGGEIYLRSLQRTRAAAAKARQLATSGIRRRGTGSEVALAEQPTVRLPRPEEGLEGPPEEEPSRLRKLRWPLIIGTSVAAFAVAILAIVGFESATGTQIGGGTGSGIGKIFGGGGHPDTTPSTTPSTSTNDTQDSPTPSTSSTTTETTPPTTSTESPTTTPTTPSTTSQQPTTSAPATSQGAATTPTP